MYKARKDPRSVSERFQEAITSIISPAPKKPWWETPKSDANDQQETTPGRTKGFADTEPQVYADADAIRAAIRRDLSPAGDVGEIRGSIIVEDDRWTLKDVTVEVSGHTVWCTPESGRIKYRTALGSVDFDILESAYLKPAGRRTLAQQTRDLVDREYGRKCRVAKNLKRWEWIKKHNPLQVIACLEGLVFTGFILFLLFAMISGLSQKPDAQSVVNFLLIPLVTVIIALLVASVPLSFISPRLIKRYENKLQEWDMTDEEDEAVTRECMRISQQKGLSFIAESTSSADYDVILEGKTTFLNSMEIGFSVQNIHGVKYNMVTDGLCLKEKNEWWAR